MVWTGVASWLHALLGRPTGFGVGTQQTKSHRIVDMSGTVMSCLGLNPTWDTGYHLVELDSNISGCMFSCIRVSAQLWQLWRLWLSSSRSPKPTHCAGMFVVSGCTMVHWCTMVVGPCCSYLDRMIAMSCHVFDSDPMPVCHAMCSP